MQDLTIICQLVVAAGIVNVWLLRPNRSTPYRPEGASDMREEFRAYGLPDWTRRLVGASKLALAAGLVIGVFVPSLAVVSAAGMVILMLAAILAHVRVRDPAIKSLPAISMLLLSAVVLGVRGSG